MLLHSVNIPETYCAPGMGTGTHGEMCQDFTGSLGAEHDLSNGKRIWIKKSKGGFLKIVRDELSLMKKCFSKT